MEENMRKKEPQSTKGTAQDPALEFEIIDPTPRIVTVKDKDGEVKKRLVITPLALHDFRKALALGQKMQGLDPTSETYVDMICAGLAVMVKERTEDGEDVAVEAQWFEDNLGASAANKLMVMANEVNELTPKQGEA